MNKKRLLTISAVILLTVTAITLLLEARPITRTKAPNQGSVSTTTTSTTATPLPPPPPSLPPINAYSINLPNALMLVDSQGRRTGKDPVTKVNYHEIPGTTYFEEFQSGQLYFSYPPKGLYTLYVLGGQTGEYIASSKVDDGGPRNPARQVISGNIQKGSMVAYTQNYDLANIASSTLVFQGASSSTASITSAPPHNLPPPPVPTPPPPTPIFVPPTTSSATSSSGGTSSSPTASSSVSTSSAP